MFCESGHHRHWVLSQWSQVFALPWPRLPDRATKTNQHSPVSCVIREHPRHPRFLTVMNPAIGVYRARTAHKAGKVNPRSIRRRIARRIDRNSYVRTVLLVLSATVLVLERIVTTEPTFDHERLDVFPRIESSTSTSTAMLSTSTKGSTNQRMHSTSRFTGTRRSVVFHSTRVILFVR